MAARPTAVQETAIRCAIGNNRVGNAGDYTDRTMTTMHRNGWITFPGDGTYRITPAAAWAVGNILLKEQYLREDLLANNPEAQRQAEVIAQVQKAGFHAFTLAGNTKTISLPVEDLARLLALAGSLSATA